MPDLVGPVARPAIPGSCATRASRSATATYGRLRPDPQPDHEVEPQGRQDRAGRQHGRRRARQRPEQGARRRRQGASAEAPSISSSNAGFTRRRRSRAGDGRRSRRAPCCRPDAAAGKTSARLGSTVTIFVAQAPAVTPPATPPVTPSAHRHGGLSSLPPVAGAQAREPPAPGRRCGAPHRRRRRSTSQLASSRWPPSVSTDSGWNCTPSSGRSRWRSAMITPPAVRPVTSSSSGRVSVAHRQRVVAGRRERRRQPGEHPGAVVVDLAGLAVQQLGRPLDDGAVAPTAIAWCPRQTPSIGTGPAHARGPASTQTPAFSGVPGPGLSSTPSYAAASAAGRPRRCARTVALGAELREVLHQVEDEAVVVVDDERCGGAWPRSSGLGGRRSLVDRHLQEGQRVLGPREHRREQQHATTAATSTAAMSVSRTGQRPRQVPPDPRVHQALPPVRTSAAGGPSALGRAAPAGGRTRSGAGSTPTAGCRS